jgi:hypothetical protein
MKTKPELMVASWPGRHADRSAYFDPTGTCVSAKLPLRLIDPQNKWLTGDEAQATNDTAIKVWADLDGTVSIDICATDIYSASVSALELRVKVLKRLTAKAAKAGFGFHQFQRDTTVFDQLARCVDALGIHRTVQYHGIDQPETFAPSAVAIKALADLLHNQMDTQRRNRERAAA